MRTKAKNQEILKYDVFISYKSQYINIVKAVVHFLEKEKIRCWYAPRDLDSKAAGKDYDDAIVNAINAARIVVVLLCDDALSSDWVKNEIAYAQKKEKTIIPYVIEEVLVDNGLRMRLDNKHWIDAWPDPERKLTLLLDNIKLLLNRTRTDGQSYSIMRDSGCFHDFDLEEGMVLLKEKEYDDAILALMASAENDNEKAKEQLCRIFYKLELRVNELSAKIWTIAERQARYGDSYAAFIMHAKYFADPSDSGIISFEYLKKAAADDKIPFAFLRLGMFYNYGIGVKQNLTLALHYYNKALDMGCTDACGFLGMMYQDGNTKLARDEKKAMEYYVRGAKSGDIKAIKSLIKYLWQNNEMDRALGWSRVAIDMGCPDGYCIMGRLLELQGGEGVKDRVVEYYKKASLLDVKEAYSALANFYWKAGNREEAYGYAKQGRLCHDSASVFYLASFNEEEGNLSEAWKYYYERYKLFHRGGENLGRLYIEKGYRPKSVSVKDLASILESSVNEGTLNYLVRLYSDNSFGIASDEGLRRVYKIGAMSHVPKYEYEYGLMFMKVDGTMYNPYKGKEWIAKAASVGYNPAVQYLEQLASREIV